MKKSLVTTKWSLKIIQLLALAFLYSNIAFAQPATITIPVGIGSPCSNRSQDSLKYYNYNDVSNVLSHRWNCKPNLAAPGFSDNLATIQFNPFDGHLYFGQITSSGPQYTTSIFRWLPTMCPNSPTPLNPYQVFNNQLVVGIEFDPNTGYGYQINFVDTTGVPPMDYDIPGTVGQYISSRIVNTRPASAQYNVTNGDLHYSRANDLQGVSWAAPITVASAGNVGQYTSLDVVNGNPAISYYNVTNGDLQYVRATNVNGTAWGAPVTVAAAGNVGQYSSLMVVNGNPAIAYYDVSNGDLMYVRATNANGTAWGTPVTIDAAGNTGQYISMLLVNGNPAISYYDVSNGDLQYVRATDANGTAWAAPVAVETAGNVGQYTSLAVVNGNPAISYYDVSNTNLKYIRATDANGTAWGSSLAPASLGNTGQYTSLAVVNGNPGIAYYNVSNGDLRFIRATDANGTTWATEEIPDAAGIKGQYASLIIASGNPAIAYYDGSGANARFIRAYDNIGDHWFTNSGVYDMELQRVDFGTNTLGPSLPINFGSRYIYRQSGDVVMTPGQKMLAAFDNKYFALNWQDYGVLPLVATFIDTLQLGAGNNLVGLAYASGKLVASVRSSTICNSFHREIDILTGALSNVTATDNFTSADMTNIPTGVGLAKRLVSLTNVSPGTYDVVYELRLKNFGGTPINNVQMYDTLNNINGFANNISASITSFTAPPGINPNPAFNGKTAGNFNLLVPGSTLSNIPGQNTIVVQITCRISGINPGIVYNNSATAYANNIFGDALRDVSTNGSNPDLNSNDKSDDVGEDQPTPLLITVPAITPPCLAMSTVLYTQNFGAGTGLSAAIPPATIAPGVFLPTGSSLYTSSVTAPLATDRYTLTNNANNANTVNFISLTDNTGNANGRMLVVNADAANTVMYRGSFYYSTCANTQYSLSFYAAFPGNGTYQTVCNAFGGFVYPQIRMRIRDGVSGLIITETTTSAITSGAWQFYGLKFTTPAPYTQLIFELINDAPGGCGNDILIDDIRFGNCDPVPTVSSNTTAGCLGQAATFTSAISDPGAISGSPQYQWQVANAPGGPWTNIVGATSSTYTIPSVAPADTGKYYRVLVSAPGNILIPNCRFASPATLLVGYTLSTPAASATRDKNNVCGGIQVTLGVTGGSLGAGAAWTWYEGSCMGTLVGTGSTINVTPTNTTTYYVRAEGLCNRTACVPVQVIVSCDIDKDDDGIPDYVESYMPLSWADANGNGVINAFDGTYPGFVDYNNDHINDNFQADGDSDNDGILNYLDTNFPGRVDTNSDGIDDRFDMDLDGIINMLDLDSDNDGIPDVVEAGGVDVNGNGRIDNFTDTDNDGFSQNVDANTTGARLSGVGLGPLDLDGDGVPNAIDRDSDNDGIPDVVEAAGPDANNNAVIDGFVDANSDGLHDAFINASGLLLTGSDIGGDGRADSYPNKNFDNDGRPNAYDIDSDNDGIVDVLEAGFADANYNGFIDGAYGADGWSNVVRALPSLALPNTDAVGQPDYLDIDSDGDGIPDNIEGQTTASYLFPAYMDSDNDGLDNSYDVAPFAATFGGRGIILSNKDADLLPDYIDLDTDADGALDIYEGHDYNFNGIADEIVTPLGTDADGDGLDDRFDLINSGPDYLKGTSILMGNGGSLTGDPSPGTAATVQKMTIPQTDRDWRFTAIVLPVYLLNLSAEENNNNVALTWKVISGIELKRFELERSTDNTHFELIKTLDANITLDQLNSFESNDNISAINKEQIYYRLKAVAVDQNFKYSNIVMVRKGKTSTAIIIYPNPATNNANISLLAERDELATVTIRDYTGKLVYSQKAQIGKGNNIIPLTNLNVFSDGVYHVQLLFDDKMYTLKLIIRN
ncbi:MAG: T9SS type A sorting domain-containing protein [Chitinophagaceae bacterium]|nr:T9SS type A sorting domain-containing protein [Chitinophagaceae bacterium]